MDAAATPACARCGLNMVEAGCPVCELPGAASSNGAALPAGVRCAVLTAAVPCRVCGLLTPLNHLPIGGAIRCLHCNRPQAADEAVVDELVARAHDVVDLAGDTRGPHEAVGRSEAAARLRFDEAWAKVGPGTPRCELCSDALSITCPEPGTVASECGGCGDRAQYRLQPPHHHRGFLGVLSSEHRVDRQSAKLTGEGAALLLSCPQCGAPLEPDSGSHVAKCKFCQVQSFITEEALAMAKGPPKSEPFYLFFSGASSLRQELERKEERRRANERHAEALARNRVHVGPASKGSALTWPQRHIGTIAGLSTPFLGMASGGLVLATLQGRYLNEDVVALPAMAVWAVQVGVGIALQGKGKIANMPTRTAHRVLFASTLTFLIVVAACFVLYVRKP